MADPLPFIPILIALGGDLQTPATAVGFKVRHYRGRDTADDEMPCCAIRFISNDPSNNYNGGSSPSLSETIFELVVDLIFSTELAPEGGADLAVADLDPTGLGAPSIMARAVIEHVLPPVETMDQGNTLGGMILQFRYDGSGDYDLARPDAAVVVERLTLQYRVRTETPTILLTGN